MFKSLSLFCVIKLLLGCFVALYSITICIPLSIFFKGRLASQIWSQNVPEHVVVFSLQVSVLKHAYFSSKSVFL